MFMVILKIIYFFCNFGFIYFICSGKFILEVIIRDDETVKHASGFIFKVFKESSLLTENKFDFDNRMGFYFESSSIDSVPTGNYLLVLEITFDNDQPSYFHLQPNVVVKAISPDISVKEFYSCTNERLQWDVLMMQGKLKRENGAYEEAFDYFIAAVDIAKKSTNFRDEFFESLKQAMSCQCAMGDHFKAFEIGYCDHEYFLQDDITAQHLLGTIECLTTIRHPLALEIFTQLEPTIDDYFLAFMNRMYFKFQFVKFDKIRN